MTWACLIITIQGDNYTIYYIHTRDTCFIFTVWGVTHVSLIQLVSVPCMYSANSESDIIICPTLGQSYKETMKVGHDGWCEKEVTEHTRRGWD